MLIIWINWKTYFVHGAAIAENEVDGAFNVAFLEVMPAGVVAESILCAVESAAGEVSFVAGNPKRHRLPPLHPRQRRRRRIL